MVNRIIMPELPEVETVKNGLEPVLKGQTIAHVALRRANLRFPFPADFVEKLVGAKVEALSRRAKYILVECSTGTSLIVHLGMTGRFTVLKPEGGPDNLGAFYFETAAGDKADGPHDHVVFTLGNGVRLVYSDPRRFGMMDVAKTQALHEHKLLKDIGVEPLGNEFSGAHLAEKFRGKSAPLKSALLDQRVVAGLGNIYVCEALHRAGLSPLRKADSLVRAKSYDPRLDILVRHIKQILHEAIQAGGSTLQDFVGADGEKGSYQQRFSAYDREGDDCDCEHCSGKIIRIAQAGRSTFYCAVCQK
jgi:formamidopyrimidine-DNA glycosylase